MFLGSRCLPCCRQVPVYAITLAGMESIPWQRSLWDGSQYNVTLLPPPGFVEISNNSYTCFTNGAGLSGMTVNAANVLWPNEVTVRIYNATTDYFPIAAPSPISDLVLKIAPVDPFNKNEPQWQVFQESGGSRVLLSGVTARLWRLSDFDESLLDPNALVVRPGNSVATRYCGFHTSRTFGPFDINLSVTVTPRPLFSGYNQALAQPAYDTFVQELDAWAQGLPGTYTTLASVPCSILSQYQGPEGSWLVQGGVTIYGYLLAGTFFASVSRPLPISTANNFWYTTNSQVSTPINFQLQFGDQNVSGPVPVSCGGPFAAQTTGFITSFPTVRKRATVFDAFGNPQQFTFTADAVHSGSVVQSV